MRDADSRTLGIEVRRTDHVDAVPARAPTVQNVVILGSG
jgi:hypothetical protein